MLKYIINQYWQLLTLTILTVICYLSLRPVQLVMPQLGLDKLLHCLAYFVLVLPLAISRPPHWKLLVLALLLISGAIELIQPFTGRYAEWLDFVMNGVGLSLGVLASERLLRSLPQGRTDRNYSSN